MNNMFCQSCCFVAFYVSVFPFSVYIFLSYSSWYWVDILGGAVLNCKLLRRLLNFSQEVIFSAQYAHSGCGDAALMCGQLFMYEYRVHVRLQINAKQIIVCFDVRSVQQELCKFALFCCMLFAGKCKSAMCCGNVQRVNVYVYIAISSQKWVFTILHVEL